MKGDMEVAVNKPCILRHVISVYLNFILYTKSIYLSRTQIKKFTVHKTQKLNPCLLVPIKFANIVDLFS